MRVVKCDRCGKEIVRVRDIDEVLGFSGENPLAKEGDFGIGRYEKSAVTQGRVGIPYILDLCDDCLKSLADWFNKGE